MRTVSVAGFAKPASKGWHGRSGGVADLEFLKGKSVVEAGFLDESQLGQESGKLAIDYKDGNRVMRAVFDYSDMGFWLVWKGEKGKENPEDALVKKILGVWGALSRSCDKKTLRIVDDPLQRQYVFMDGSRKVIELSCVELKIMGKEVYAHFQGGRNIDGIVESIRLWVIDHQF